MRKKDTGGYALAYVLVIILVLCAVAMSICAVALRNFQSQERSVVQTRQLYQAEGEVEKFVALAEDLSTTISGSSEICATMEAAQAQAEENCKSSYENELINKKAKLDTTKGSVVLSIDSTVANRDLCKFTLIYQNEAIKIETSINMALSYDNSFEEHEYDIDGDEVTDLIKWSCISNVKTASHTYLSYIITHLNEEEGGEP